ncbi:hypothetical protein HA520_10430 [Azotobacter chroococcum]|uniref:Uncharacterized protein n=1 Tax=Azotobacter chroococcum TaxID=353 RepID=A0AA43Z693_9GAMM|nr:hypothetical protein [Azotobacter chroococcum]NHN77695.1 hypothetical protein [Azotobacter chroococcum]
MSQTDLAVFATAAETVSPAPRAVTFIDRAYKSRTLLLEDGSAFAVERSRLAASDQTLIEFLDRHPDFSREA